MKFILIPTVNQRYNMVKIILRENLFGTETYNFTKDPKNKINIPTNKKIFKK